MKGKPKIEKPLEDRIKEAEKFIGVEIGKKYNTNFASWGFYWSYQIRDIIYKKIGEYKVVALHVERHESALENANRGVEWEYRTELIVSDNKKTIKKTAYKEVVRDAYSDYYDKPHLWDYTKIGLVNKGGKKIKVYWKNSKGEKYKGSEKEYNLEELFNSSKK